MTRWTEAQLEEYLTRRQSPVRDALADYDMTHEADEGPESKLAGRITKWARDKGYPCLCLRQSPKAKGFIQPGWPDVTLVLEETVMFFELKSAEGRLRPEQNDMALMFQYLGNRIHVVKSFKRFNEVIEERRNYEREHGQLEKGV